MPKHDHGHHGLDEQVGAVAHQMADESKDPSGPGPKDPKARSFAADLLMQRYTTNVADATRVAPPIIVPAYDPNRADVKSDLEQRRFQGTPFVTGAGDANAVDPNDVRQGGIGDCWLMSALIAVARANPRAIMDLIKDLGGGRYEVTLYIGAEKKIGSTVTREPVKIVVNDVFPLEKGSKTQSKYADPGDRGPQGPELWVMLIEKAYAKHNGGYEGQSYLGTGLNARFESAIEDLLPSGEMTGIPLASSTIKDVLSPLEAAGRKASTDSFKAHPAVLLNTLSRALADKRPVTAMTLPDLELFHSDLAAKYKLVKWHHYALMSVDVAGGTMCWQNPWGSQHVMNITVTDFVEAYAHVQIGPSLRGPVDSMPTKKPDGNATGGVT